MLLSQGSLAEGQSQAGEAEAGEGLQTAAPEKKALLEFQ